LFNLQQLWFLHGEATMGEIGIVGIVSNLAWICIGIEVKFSDYNRNEKPHIVFILADDLGINFASFAWRSGLTFFFINLRLLWCRLQKPQREHP
jgi:hypothetical protein